MTEVLFPDRENDASRWEALVDAAEDRDIYYRHGYVQAAGSTTAALVVDTGPVRALIPLVLRTFDDLAFANGERGGDAITPYGYGGVLPLEGRVDAAAFVEALRAWCIETGNVSVMLRLHPVLRQSEWDWRDSGAVYHHHGPTTGIDLGKWNDAAQCIATMRKGHRADLGAARKLVEVRWGRDDDQLATFRSLYEDTMERLGASVMYRFPLEYYQALSRGLGERLTIGIAYAGSTAVAGSMFMADDHYAHYHLSGARTAQRVRGAATLLVNDGAAWARSRGCRVLHLGGGTTGADTLFAFKKGFGGDEYSYGFVTVIGDLQRYEALLARRMSANLPAPRPGFFPAYRA